MPPASLLELSDRSDFGIRLTPALDVWGWLQAEILADTGSIHNKDHAHLIDADIRVMWASSSFEKQGRRVLGQAEQVAFRAGGWQKARMAKWAEQVGTRAQAVATTMIEYRTEEQRRQKAANQVANDARQEQTAAIADAVVADAAGDRLRSEAGKLAASASCVPSDSRVADRGKNATRAAMVLSDLLSRADARARDLARYADQLRVVAGRACESTYSSLLSIERK